MWSPGTCFLQTALCLGFALIGLHILNAELTLWLPSQAMWVLVCLMACIKVEICLLGPSYTCCYFICSWPTKIEMLIKLRFIVWECLFQKGCDSEEKCFNYGRENIGGNLLLSFFTLAGQWHGEMCEVDEEASMGVKKSLCGSAAVFPDHKKAGQQVAFFWMHPLRYTVLSARKMCSFCSLNWHRVAKESSLFQVLNTSFFFLIKKTQRNFEWSFMASVSQWQQ